MIRKNFICKAYINVYPYVKNILFLFPELKRFYSGINFTENLTFDISKRGFIQPYYACYTKSTFSTNDYRKFEINSDNEVLSLVSIFQIEFLKHNFLNHAPESLILIN